MLDNQQANVPAGQPAADAVRPLTFSTRTLAVRDQHDAWQDWFRPMFDVRGRHPSKAGFGADHRATRLGDVTVSQVRAPAVHFVRSRAHLKRDPTDHWVLTCCRRGATTFRSNGSVIEAPPGVPFLWTLAAETESVRTDVERTAIYLPRDSLREVAHVLDASCGAIMQSALGGVLGDYMLSLDRWLPNLSATEAPRLAASLRAIVSASVSPSPDRLAIAGTQLDFGRMERVRRAVRRHLRSHKLTPSALSRAVGISRSNLYRLFEGAGGVSHYIQSQRLLEAHAALCDPALDASIAAIADMFCFADASSFSRAFRREFGHTPSEVRAAALAGFSPAATLQSCSGSELGDFARLLRPF